MTKYLSLIEFFEQSTFIRCSAHVSHGHMRMWLRRNPSARLVEISEIRNVYRSKNFIKREKHTKTGLLSDVLTAIEQMSKDYQYKYVRVTGIVNEFLPEVLARRGYLPIPPDAPIGMGTDMQLRVLPDDETATKRV